MANQMTNLILQETCDDDRGRNRQRFSLYNPRCDHENLVYEIIMRFESPSQFKRAVQQYAILNGIFMQIRKKVHKSRAVKNSSGKRIRAHTKLTATLRLRK